MRSLPSWEKDENMKPSLFANKALFSPSPTSYGRGSGRISQRWIDRSLWAIYFFVLSSLVWEQDAATSFSHADFSNWKTQLNRTVLLLFFQENAHQRPSQLKDSCLFLTALGPIALLYCYAFWWRRSFRFWKRTNSGQKSSNNLFHMRTHIDWHYMETWNGYTFFPWETYVLMPFWCVHNLPLGKA